MGFWANDKRFHAELLNLYPVTFLSLKSLCRSLPGHTSHLGSFELTFLQLRFVSDQVWKILLPATN
jgi:hypothetical protein